MPGKSVSELQWLHDQVQLLFETTQNVKAQDYCKDLTGEPNKINTIEYKN